MMHGKRYLRWLAVGALCGFAVSAAGNPDPGEFEKVQRAMNERIEELEAELAQSRQQWITKEGAYQAQVAQLESRSRQLEAALEEADQRPAGARDWGQGWSVRRVESERSEEEGESVDASTDFPALAIDETEEAAEDPPVEVIDPRRLGRRRIPTRRDDMQWRTAMQFSIRNLRDTPLRVNAWAHRPGRMGWTLDDFGVAVIDIPPRATITDRVIAYDDGMELNLLIDGNTYTFEVNRR